MEQTPFTQVEKNTLKGNGSMEQEGRTAIEQPTRKAFPTEKETSDMDMEVLSLIARSQRGDHAAYSQLMDLYRERVVRLALHMVGNMEDAYDLTQETFVRVYRSLGTYDRKRTFTPWLYRIAHNVIIDHFRKKSVRPALAELEDEWPLESAPDNGAADPQQALISGETQRQVQAAIQSLPENYRSVVVFRFVDDLSYTEIAETLGLTEANVMMRMSRARRMLREKLQYLQAGTH